MRIDVLTGGSIDATPRLLLPDGTIRVRVMKGARPERRAVVVAHILEGGGGFPGPDGLRSETRFTTDNNGEAALPPLALGPRAEPNRLLIHADHAHVIVTVRGSWDHTEIIRVSPTGLFEEVSTNREQCSVRLCDTQYPNEPIAGSPLGLEIKKGGGWLDRGGLFSRAFVVETDSMGEAVITHYFSAREEVSVLRVFSIDGPAVPELLVDAHARRPRLLATETASRSHREEVCAKGWISKLLRLEPVDSRQDVRLFGPPPFRAAEILAEMVNGGGEVYPGRPVTGRGTNYNPVTMVIRPPHRTGPFDVVWKARLPDFPDDPERTIVIPSDERYSGPPTFTHTPGPVGDIFVETDGGGVRDEPRGVEIVRVAGDVQYVGPNAMSPAPWEIDLVTIPLADPNRRLRKVKVTFKLHVTPGNSAVDDPTNPNVLPGTIDWVGGTGGGDELRRELPGTGTHRLAINFTSNELNFDHFVEFKAVAVIGERSSGLTWLDHDEETTLLARAIFFHPRVSFTRQDIGTGDFVAIDGRAILPSPIVDPKGNAIPHERTHEIFLEMRCHDVGPVVDGRVTGGNRYVEPVPLKRVGAPSGVFPSTLYRSGPIVCHLERPESFGVQTLPIAGGAANITYVFVEEPFTVHGMVSRAMPNNTRPRAWITAERPVSFIRIAPTHSSDLRPTLPRPRLEFPSLNTRDDGHPVKVHGTTVTLELSGVVRDTLADVTNFGNGNLREVTVTNGSVSQQVPVSGSGENIGVLRPFAWKGTFDAKIPLNPGLNVVDISATNAVGGRSDRTLFVDLIDERNDYEHPDASTMAARVRIGAVPERPALTELALITYRTPHTIGASTMASSGSVVLESLEERTGGTVLDTISQDLERVQGVENIFVAHPVVLVPEGIDPALHAAAQASGLPVLKHRTGGRVLVRGSLPHPVATQLRVQTVQHSADREIRLLVEDDHGDFQIADRVVAGRNFTLEVRSLQPVPLTGMQLDVMACDRLGQELPQPDRWVTCDFAQGPHPGWLRLQSVRATATQPDDGWVVPITRSAEVPPGDHALRVIGGGTIHVSEGRGGPLEFIWPVAHEPARQEDANGRPITFASPCGTSASAGVWKSVTARTGELVHAEQDAHLHGRGIDLQFVRTYRSFTLYDGPMGESWSHSFDSWLRRESPDRYVLVDEEGRRHPFVRGSAGTFEPSSGIYALLEEDGEGLVRVRWPGGAVQVFAAAAGLDRSRLPLWMTLDACSNRIASRHDQVGTLVSVADPLEQRIYLRYGDRGRVEAVGDITGRRWSYRYHGGTSGGGSLGDLQAVNGPAVRIGPQRYPKGKTHTFRYEATTGPGDPLAHKMLGMQDPRGVMGGSGAAAFPELLTIGYDAAGRVTTQRSDGASYEIQYPSATERIVLDGTGHETRFRFSHGAATAVEHTLPSEFVEVDGAEFKTTFQYNGQTELVRITSPMGATTVLEYDAQASDPRARGNLLRRRRLPVAGLSRELWSTNGLSDATVDPTPHSPAEIVWTYTYEPRCQRVKTATDSLGRTTSSTFDYEAGGRSEANLVQAVGEPATVGTWGGGPQRRIVEWEYNNFGQPLAAVDENGVRTEFWYYPAARPNGGAAPARNPQAPSGHLARIVSDARPASARRSASLVAARPITMDISYDARGEIATTRVRGGTTKLQHNELGQLVRRTQPDGLVEAFWHDANDCFIQMTQEVRDAGVPAGGPPVPPRTVTHRYAYDRHGRQTAQVIDSTGMALTTTWGFDAAGRVERVTSPVSNATGGDPHRVTAIAYDKRGRVLREAAGAGSAQPRITTYGYDDDGNVETILSARGTTTTLAYDAWGNEREIVSPDGSIKTMRCNAAGETNGITVTGSIDGSSGARATLADEWIYRDQAGRVWARVEKAFRPTAGGGTPIGSGRRVTRYERDEGGHPVVVHTPRGLSITTLYTGHGRPARVSNPLTGRVTYEYDGAGNLESVSLPGPRSVGSTARITLRRTYDAMGRETAVEVPGGAFAKQAYDTLGQLRMREDPIGNRTYFEYDGAGRQRKVRQLMHRHGRLIDPATGAQEPLLATFTTEYGYDANDNLFVITDPEGNEALYQTFDSLDQAATARHPKDQFPSLGRDDNPGAETYTYTYWLDGTLHTATSPDGLVVSRGYDSAGRPATTDVSVAPGTPAPRPVIAGTQSQSFTYDGLGRCVEAVDTDANGVDRCRVVREYDSLGNLWSDRQAETYTGGTVERTTTATFDERGDMTLQTYDAPGVTVGYHYDAIGRMRVVSGHAAYDYDRAYLDARRYVASDLVLDVTHDKTGRVQVHRHVELDPAGTVLSLAQGEEILEWNPTGSPLLVKNQVTGKARAQLYDSMGRGIMTAEGLSAATPGTLAPQVGNTAIWTEYDARGNVVAILSGLVDSVTSPDDIEVKLSRCAERVVNAANEVGQNTERVDPANYVLLPVRDNRPSTSGASGLASQGQESFRHDRRGNLVADGTRDYTYDALDRLARVVNRATGMATDFRYDAFGRRLVKGDIRFLYHGDRLLEEIPGRATWRKRYVHAGDGIVGFAMRAGGGQTRQYYLHEDRTGSIQFLSERGGGVIERYGYDPAGLPTLSDPVGNPLSLGQAAGNPFLQHGQYFDPETGLYYMGARYYHPGLQRMMQRDPMGLDEVGSAYAFARNNPQGYRDPSGAVPFIIPILIGGALFGLAFSAVLQLARMHDKTQAGWDVNDLLWGAILGACFAPIVLAAPWVGVALGVYSGVEAGRAAWDGRNATAGVLAVGAVLGLISPKVPRSSLFFHRGTCKTFRSRMWRLITKSRRQIDGIVWNEKLTYFSERNAARRARLIRIIDRVVDRFGFPRENVHVFDDRIPGLTRSAGDIGSGGGMTPAYLSENNHLFIDLRFFQIFGHSRESRPYFVRRVRHVYPRLSVLLAHELSHYYNMAGHYRPGRFAFGNGTFQNDASYNAIRVFYGQWGQISRACARSLIRSVAPEYQTARYEYLHPPPD